MGSATMDRRLSVSHFSRILDNFQSEQREDGTWHITGMPVFRSGTFRDSMGDQHNWEIEHLQQMVFHFGLLRDRNIFPNVPVRDGHRSIFGGGSSLGGGRTVGYVTDLYLGGKDDKGNTLLLADYEITEPDAYEKIDRGTFRARSSEVGYYETNDEVLYWPVYQGFAFVDIPAVEGLFSKKDKTSTYTLIRDEEEGEMPPEDSTDQTGGEETPPTTPPATEDAPPTPASTPPAPSVENNGGDGGDEEDGGDATPPPTSEHSAPPAGGVQMFTIGGQQTNDFAAVQSHIDNLEALNHDFAMQGRDEFVTSLANRNVIAATQVEAMQQHARNLTPEQFESFRSMWESAPGNPLFEQHGGSQDDPDGSHNGGAPTEKQTLRDRIEFARRAGMTEDQIKATDSYKRLQELESQA